MTQEVKAYDEALERAKIAYKDGDKHLKATLERIFPELRENEDERIRKELLAVINDLVLPDEQQSRFIAWLEKQADKEKPQVYETEDSEVITYSESEGYKVIKPKFYEGNWVVDNCNNLWKIEEILGQFYRLEGVEGDESCPTIEWVDKTFHLWNIHDAKDGDILVCPLHKKYESGEQIFIFKGINNRDYVDNCIEYYCRICQGDFYENTNGYMGTTSCVFYPATKEQCNLLFQKMYEAGYEWNTEMKELRKIHVIDEGKDEMDYCFTKMMNSEKVSPAWSEEDEVKLKSACALIRNTSINGNEGIEDFTINWLKSLKGRIQTKQGWSEEDKVRIEQICDDLKCGLENFRAGKNVKGLHFEEIIKSNIDWLKSLIPQNKYVYNPYKAVVESIIEMCKHYDKSSHSGLRDFYDNVKVKCKDAKEYDSIYPQNTWKPSNEQMGALTNALSLAKNCGEENAFDLRTLYEQLKKLKD